MPLIFKSTTQISLNDLSPERLNSYDIKLVEGYEPARVYAYLCSAATTVRIHLDGNGYCDFAIPDNVPFPFSILDALRNEYKCDLVRVIDDRGHGVTSLGEHEVLDALEHHQGAGDRIISYINGRIPDSDPGCSQNEMARIGRNLVEQNPHLSKDPQTLLRLVTDLYEQRHPPFKVTLKTRNSKVARLYARAMLDWAGPGTPTSVTDIKRRLSEMIGKLNDFREWPADCDSVSNFWRALEGMGLAVLGKDGSKRYTELGIACGAHLASYFIGAHEAEETPALLAQEGLIEDEEAQGFYSFLRDYKDKFFFDCGISEREFLQMLEDNMLREVKRLVRKAYRRFCSMEEGERSEVLLDDLASQQVDQN